MKDDNMRSVLVPTEYISPEMKFFPLAIPVIIVRSSANNSSRHFNAVTIPNDYGYYNISEYDDNSTKFISALLLKFNNYETYFRPRKRKQRERFHHNTSSSSSSSELGYYVDEKLIVDDNVFPPYVDHGFSGIDEFIEYNVNRIYEGTVKLNEFLRKILPSAFKN